MGKYCNDCKVALPEEANFCSSCGARQTKVKDNDGLLERRQITVMFSDLVGSTRLSETMDTEDYADLIENFQETIATAVKQNKGYVAKYMGDGALIYFGYPTSIEYAPVHAVHAARAIIKNVKSLGEKSDINHGTQLEVRVGIHTGLVVAGHIGSTEFGEKNAIVGVTPNVAARLEAMAKPGTIVVSDETRKRVSHYYEATSLGPVTLRGIGEPIEAFVIGEEKLREDGQDITVVGREPEIEVLERMFLNLKPNTFARASLIGPAGIGKTSIIKTFLDKRSANGSDVHSISISGVETDRSSTLRSILRMTQKALSDGVDDSEIFKCVTKLKDIIDHINQQNTDQYADPIYSVSKAFIDYIQSVNSPVILTLEDRQWIDSVSLMVLSKVFASNVGHGVILIDTSREQNDDTGLPAGRDIHLTGISNSAAKAIIKSIDTESTISIENYNELVKRAAGNPMFLEELARCCVNFSNENESFEINAFLAQSSRLNDILLARMDGLGAGNKSLIKLGAVIGDIFAIDEISELLNSGEDLLDKLELLQTQNIIMPMDIATIDGHKRYRYQHVLLREVAYSNLLRKDRQRLHSLLARWIAAKTDWQDRWTPEEVAHHFAKGDSAIDALPYWILAAERAEKIGAFSEAIASCVKALTVLNKSDYFELDKNSIKLKLYRIMAPSIIASKGRLNSETITFFETAVSHCLSFPDNPDSYSVLWCWWRIGQNLFEMNKRAKTLLALANSSDLAELEMQSHHCLWAVNFLKGQHDEVFDNVGRGLALYEADRDEQGIAHFGGHDAKVCGVGELALSNWVCGKPNSAKDYLKECLSNAYGLNHKGSLLHALDIAAIYNIISNNTMGCRDVVNQWQEIYKDMPTEEYNAKINFFTNWCAFTETDSIDALSVLAGSLVQLSQIGVNEDMPVYLAVMAESYLKLGYHLKAREFLNKALKTVDETGVEFWNSEINRLDAEISMYEGAVRTAIIKKYTKGIETAQRQNAVTLETRLNISFCKFLLQNDNPEGALNILDTFKARLSNLDTEIDMTAIGIDNLDVAFI